MKKTRVVHPGWYALILVALVVAAIPLCVMAFKRDFVDYANVTLVSDRAGLVMDVNAVVKYRGVEVGRVASIDPKNGATLGLELNPSQLRYIPANVEAQISSPTVFGAKYVDLRPPPDPSRKRLQSGAVLTTNKVSIESNSVLKDLVSVLNQIDPAKINAVVSALAEGFRGKGEAIGQAITDFNQVLMAVNPRSELLRADWRAFGGFSDTYAGAAQSLVTVLDAGAQDSAVITRQSEDLDFALVTLTGLGKSGGKLFDENNTANLIHLIKELEPTTRLLMKYNPELTCTFLGAKLVMDRGYADAFTFNGRSFLADAGLLFGDDAYRYPENLPVIDIKGGPGGTPSCGSLPDVEKNFPQRYLITNSGFGPGIDVRPNPGIGFPGYAVYSPSTRGTPLPPTLKDEGGPAPGPVPYPGAPPYGAPRYAPDGTPLYPGLPPAPPAGRPRDPGMGKPPAGSEPFVPPYPGTPAKPR
ncbi:MCE-family protein MCE3A [Mycobacterium triplex]|uniref:MCE-family protein MCE3A n=1 Tax=Mycobacterium triplex TaxID=47839 RepID=A0A024K3B4_9MYCO|nr:MCE family protein [Mycobacterium triplex]ORW99790.1 MCE-family protein MCE3A [Mycobacterium triplex]CDO90406.1 virulence factor Mce family protein [Mycobacterium triplex]